MMPYITIISDVVFEPCKKQLGQTPFRSDTNCYGSCWLSPGKGKQIQVLQKGDVLELLLIHCIGMAHHPIVPLRILLSIQIPRIE